MACRHLPSRTPTLNLSFQCHISVRNGLPPPAIAYANPHSGPSVSHLRPQWPARCLPSRTPTLNLSFQCHISVRNGLPPPAVAYANPQSGTCRAHLRPQWLARKRSVFASVHRGQIPRPPCTQICPTALVQHFAVHRGTRK